ncbi:MAG: Membrane protein insertase YidC [Pedosphaera sp.]|nr:Membrane protein insertase YidC [Pedosphaera sp.]
MDRKAIIVVVLCFVLMVTWWPMYNHFHPAPPPSTNVVTSATNQLATGTNAPAAEVTQPYMADTNAPSAFVVSKEIPEQLLVVSNENARYTFTSRGGGLKTVELLHYPETVSSVRGKNSHTNDVATLHAPSLPPVLSIMGSGNETLQGDGVFELTQTNGVVHAEKKLTNGLTVVKDFQIGTNYLVGATVRLENRSKQPLTLPAQEWIVGAATPMGPQDNAQGVGVDWYDGTNVVVKPLAYFNTNTTAFIFFHHTPIWEYRAGSNNVVWVAPHNQFFVLATMPKVPAPGLVVRLVDLPHPSQEEIEAAPHVVTEPKGLETALTYPGVTLAAGQNFEQTFNFYAGPKEYKTLARIGAQFNNHLDLVMEFGFFSWLSKALLASMGWLNRVLHLPYGWAIVVITVLIKLIFWPLTAYSTRSMKRMQALQPQMKAMQEKYKDDPTKLSQKQFEFWRKNKVNPLSGCLPMLLQLPVLWGFYGMLRSAIELRGQPFLWVGDLSKPDTIFSLPIPLHLFGMSAFPVNPMPLIMGATMLWQTSMTPPSPGMDPAQQRIMRFMPLMMVVFLYNFSSGLALYWTVQNLLTVLQTKLTKTQPDPAAAKAPAPVPPQKKKK